MAVRGKNSKSCCSSCNQCWSSFISLAFSALGLIIAIVTYSVIGGLLFQHLESDREKEDIMKARVDIDNIKEAFLINLLNISIESEILIEENDASKFDPPINKRSVALDVHVGTANVSTPSATERVSVRASTLTFDANSSSNSSTISEYMNDSNITSVGQNLAAHTSDSIPVTLSRIIQTTSANLEQEEEKSNTVPYIYLTKEQKIIWEAKVREHVENYYEKIYSITKANKWDGKKASDLLTDLKWSFPEALLYAVSAITTIGYGHVTPKTMAGQMVTIVYCIIGLPLTLMCIAKLGKAFACAFRVIYHTCCCAICCLACIAKKNKEKYRSEKLAGSDINDALGALVIGKNGQGVKDKFLNDAGFPDSSLTTMTIWREIVQSKYKMSLKHDTAVPTYLCLVVMAAYITGGTYLFAEWEGWEYHEGAYFCFVTLTTIGFGDFVPGVKTSEKQNLVLCALYVLIGLALIGMCIDLMQVDVVKKFKWIAQKIGLSKPKHVKTTSDKKKEKVGLKLSSETLPQMVGQSQSLCSTMNHHDLVTRSLSHNLEVPSPLSVRSNSVRKCVSMPNTPIAMKSPSQRPSGFFQLPLATREEPEISDTESTNVEITKCNGGPLAKCTV